MKHVSSFNIWATEKNTTGKGQKYIFEKITAKNFPRQKKHIKP